MYPLKINIRQKHIFRAKSHIVQRGEIMVYLDNAATSRYKPKCVLDALVYDITHSANSGRSGHSEAVKKEIQTENCRQYLKNMLGADVSYEVIFTKSCTEALNLAILGGIKDESSVLTSSNEHNSVLRPLAKLQNEGKISLDIVYSDSNGKLDYNQFEDMAKDKNVIIAGAVSNVTGYVCDLEKVGQIARQNNAIFIVDGAQGVPIVDINMADMGIDMLACPAHKGLHALQGVGFLIVKKNIPLKPLIYGGTGTASNEILPEIIMPESYEAGTQFSAGINALYHGAKWSFDNLQKTKKHLVRMSKNLKYVLKEIGATLYCQNEQSGIVTFNIKDIDSGVIADELNMQNICVRSGLHCAPLVHKQLGTTLQGAVRLSVGVDTTDNDISIFANAIEYIAKKHR